MKAPASQRAARGIVLIEVLVSLLIFAFGVLGLVGLQAVMTRNQTDSDARAKAGYLATEIIGRMWADRPNLATYATSAKVPCAASTACADWRAKVATQLPTGAPIVVVDTTTGDVSVVIDWALPNGASHTYSTSSQVQ